MEKGVPHYPLATVKTLLAGKVRTTYSCLAGAAALGLSAQDIVAVVGALTSKDFYKSMTTHADLRCVA